MNIVMLSVLKRILFILRFIIFFLGPGMLYHYLKKKKTWNQLDEYAKENGIKKQLTDSYDDFGEMLWEFNHRPVRVRICYDNPSFGPWISVGLKLSTDMLNLKTYRPMTRPGEGWVEFDSPSPEFNYLYKTRQIREGFLEKLMETPTIFDDIVDFYGKWMFDLSNDIGTNGLVIDGEVIQCIFGPSMIQSMFPCITPRQIDQILPEMIELADRFDRAAGIPVTDFEEVEYITFGGDSAEGMEVENA